MLDQGSLMSSSSPPPPSPSTLTLHPHFSCLSGVLSLSLTQQEKKDRTINHLHFLSFFATILQASEASKMKSNHFNYSKVDHRPVMNLKRCGSLTSLMLFACINYFGIIFIAMFKYCGVLGRNYISYLFFQLAVNWKIQ